MEANLGGTEIGSALQHVLSMRTPVMPTAVFVLTDGEVQVANTVPWNTKADSQFVEGCM